MTGQSGSEDVIVPGKRTQNKFTVRGLGVKADIGVDDAICQSRDEIAQKRPDVGNLFGCDGSDRRLRIAI
mgnify:CR=1 FL=1